MQRTSTRTCHCQHRQGVGVSGSSFFAIRILRWLRVAGAQVSRDARLAAYLLPVADGRRVSGRRGVFSKRCRAATGARLAPQAAAQPRGRAVRAREWRSRQPKGIERDPERSRQIASGREHSSRRTDRCASRVLHRLQVKAGNCREICFFAARAARPRYSAHTPRPQPHAS